MVVGRPRYYIYDVCVSFNCILQLELVLCETNHLPPLIELTEDGRC